MEEKILIKSIRSEKAYRNNLILIYALSAGSAFFFAFFFSLEMGFETFGMCFWLWLLMFSTPFALIFHFVLKKTFDRVSIVVTNYKITGAYGFKEQMNIPIDSISSVTMNSSFYSAIGFTCAGNAYRMSYIENRKEIIRMLDEDWSITDICKRLNVSRDTFTTFKGKCPAVQQALSDKEKRRDLKSGKGRVR